MTKTEEVIQHTIDKKRVFIAIVIIAVFIGVGGVWAKNNLPKFLADNAKKEILQKEGGKVEGLEDVRIEVDGQKREVAKQIDAIKENIINLKPEDIKEQEPVKKILSDLDELKDKATESAKIFNIKGNLCEEAKKRFCE